MSNIIQILTNTTRLEWENMSHQQFISTVIEDLNMMSNENFNDIIANLTYPQFEAFSKKCWEEQDQPPENVDDEEVFRKAYDQTLPILILLENALNLRIELELDLDKKKNISQQLALLRIILSPHLLDDFAQKMN